MVMQSSQIHSIVIGGLCHHTWEMPIEVFESSMIVGFDLSACSSLTFLTARLNIGLIYCCALLYSLQRLYQDIDIVVLPENCADSMVPPHDLGYNLRS